jgi:glutamate/tyrosine decarboxylase-like PLP-dependent enzyme
MPDIDFDWDADTWRRHATRLLETVIAASTNWEARRPSPLEGPGEVHERFRRATPRAPLTIAELAALIEREVIPLSSYNGHPRWLAYITAGGTPAGVLGELIAAALNQNTALWRASPAATAIELQTIEWIKEMTGFPAGGEGLFVSGGQLANVVAHAVARDARAGWDVRARGLAGRPLRIYASEEIHYCHQQAAELLGLGRESVRLVPTDDRYRLRVDELRRLIAADRAAGFGPLSVVGTAGTVGTGAVDPLPEIARICREEGLWFHVDGAYGAFARLAPSAPEALAGMAEADSLACDPHKWLYSPLDAGVILVREPGLLEGSFAFHATYLQTRGETGRVDLLERSLENSRPQRAFKVWFELQAYGLSAYRQMIERDLGLARYLAELVGATPHLELAAPTELSVVCWRVVPPGVGGERLEDLQLEVIAELERQGEGLISNARLKDGRTALRACFVNFRTRPEHVEQIVAASARLGEELAARAA